LLKKRSPIFLNEEAHLESWQSPSIARKDRTNKKQKQHTAMNKNASLTPVQGSSTVVCMTVT
jgi:hypothetical protein